MDEDGDYWLMGRIDDVVNVSGHRIGTAEVESALVSHPKVAEAAVAPMPHDIKGQGLYAFVTLMDGVEQSDELQEGTGQARPQGNRADRHAGQDPVRARPAQDPLAARSCAASCARSPRTQIDQIGDTTTLADPPSSKRW